MDSANALEVASTTSKHKKCTACGEDKPESEFSFRNKKKGLRQARCKTCFREYAKQHYSENRQRYIDSAKRSRKRLIQRKKDHVAELLETAPCVDCGFSDPRALQFDHLDPKTKKHNIADMVSGRYNSASLEALKEELEKCVVRCANCHQIKTGKTYNYWKNDLQGVA